MKPQNEGANSEWEDFVTKEAARTSKTEDDCRRFLSGVVLCEQNAAKIPAVAELIKVSKKLFNVHVCYCAPEDECICHEAMTQVKEALKALESE